MEYQITINEDDILSFIEADLEGLKKEIVLKNFKPIIITFEVKV